MNREGAIIIGLIMGKAHLDCKQNDERGHH